MIRMRTAGLNDTVHKALFASHPWWYACPSLTVDGGGPFFCAVLECHRYLTSCPGSAV